MLTLNLTLLNQVVNSATRAAGDDQRWVNAIDRAALELTTNPYLERQDGHLLIASPSGQVYSSNGVCQCKAYEHGRPCWHRAAARLVQRYDEAQTQQQAAQPQSDDWGARYDRWAAQRKAQAEMDELFS